MVFILDETFGPIFPSIKRKPKVIKIDKLNIIPAPEIVRTGHAYIPIEGFSHYSIKYKVRAFVYRDWEGKTHNVAIY